MPALALSLFAVIAVCGATPAQGQTAPPPPVDARAVLLRMADALGKTPHLGVTVRASYDTVQPSGDKIEWNEIRKLTLSRPDKLRVETEKSDGARTLVVFDGKAVSTFDESTRLYAQTSQQGGVDETLIYFVRDLGMRLPLAALFMSKASSELDRRTRAVEHVQKTAILGTPTHHLVGRTDSVNFQVWIRDGDPPFPERLVLTYPGAPGQPQFRAEFSGWSVAVEPVASIFSFTPPANATRIPFVAALPRSARDQGSASPKTAPAPKSGAPATKKGATP
jgi:hypothetical protein